MKTLSKSNNKV